MGLELISNFSIWSAEPGSDQGFLRSKSVDHLKHGVDIVVLGSLMDFSA